MALESSLYGVKPLDALNYLLAMLGVGGGGSGGECGARAASGERRSDEGVAERMREAGTKGASEQGNEGPGMRRKRSAEDFAEEIKAHLELEAAELKSEGVDEDEARRQARVGFGNVGVAQERFHLRNRIAWFDNLARDLRYGMRGAWRNPGFAAVAMLTMALAIGAMTAIFSLLDQALLRALPVRNPERLVVLSFAGDHPGHHHSEGGNSPGIRTSFRIRCSGICARRTRP